jgi:hypothetical protein
LTFDAPSRETCVVERQATTTPLQTLAIWNDEGMAAAARAFGERLAAADGDVVEVAFLRLLQRRPTAAERRTCRDLLTAVGDGPDGLTLLASTLFSLDEAMHRN